MTDSFNQNGLTVDTRNEIVAALKEGFAQIYGADINVDSNSPDGQLIEIFAQSAYDLRELLVQINSGFSPQRAVGRILDERVAINNISRKAGTFTIVPITIVTSATVSLQGLDADFNNINGTGYTIQDNAGNQFILVDSDVLTAGTHANINFRAKEIGAVETVVDTITNPVTIVLGVTSVNNPSAALQLGQNEETDAELRARQKNSVALASSGYLNGLRGTLLAIDGVTDARLYENVTNIVDADGIPAHGIWAIVEGGSNTDIGDAIYSKKSFGCDMKGDVEVDIETPSGIPFIAKFDRPTAEDLHIRFDIQPTYPGASFDQDEIKSYIVDNLVYTIGQFAETASITVVAINAIISTSGNVGVPVNVEISNNGADWVDYLETTLLSDKFVVDSTRITITVL